MRNLKALVLSTIFFTLIGGCTPALVKFTDREFRVRPLENYGGQPKTTNHKGKNYTIKQNPVDYKKESGIWKTPEGYSTSMNATHRIAIYDEDGCPVCQFDRLTIDDKVYILPEPLSQDAGLCKELAAQF